MGEVCDCGKKNNKENRQFKIDSISNNNLYNMYNLNYICHIKSSKINRIGSFLKIAIDNELFYCIITNIELNKEELLKVDESIEVYYNKRQDISIINLKENERFLRYYKDINTTVIQILIDKDNIPEDYFFLPKSTYGNLVDKKIYIIQISDDNKYNKFQGEIKNIKENKFTHSANVKNGFSGNYVFLESINEFIGINLESKKNDNEGNGYFLSEIESLLKNGSSGKEISIIQKIEKKEIHKEMNKVNSTANRIDLTNGNYYIGKIVDGKMHGKGIMYYKNNSIMYDGDFVDNKFEGNGKFIYDDGIYYIGQFVKGEKHGKGKLYDKNGNLIYEGDFMNDKIEGEGKIFDNDEYYIGQFEDGEKKGKGKEFYKNGKLKYEGFFDNDVYEGNGKFIYEDDDYYIGQWHKGLKEGKGILYDKNNKIKYDGNYINNKYGGKGKYFYENGDYFEGNWSNGVKQGKGIEYYLNGNIRYEGNFDNNEFNGDGKYINEDGSFYVGRKIIWYK